MSIHRLTLFEFIFVFVGFNAWAENRIDTQRPDAPELAGYGLYAIEVRTLEVANPNQIDMLKLEPNSAEPAKIAIQVINI